MQDPSTAAAMTSNGMKVVSSRGLRVAGLFAGIGGIELGLHAAGHETELLCEIDDGAQAVLREHFPELPLVPDIRDLASLPDVDLVAAGFPCQDLSQAGRTAGIGGRNSGLVQQVFRLLEDPAHDIRWLLLENVPFMLHLDRGQAMRYLTDALERLGFSWAYRIVDTRAFGLPHRRQRVIMLASRSEDPRGVLLVDDEGEPAESQSLDGLACGFYWTEGLRGLGWAVDAVPTLKGGSTIGIPSPPGIWMPDGSIVTPDLRDAERLQGFPADWTVAATGAGRARKGARWKLVGNAVSVPVFHWVGKRLCDPRPYESERDQLLAPGSPWPKAAWGRNGEVHVAGVSAWPVRQPRQHLASFLRYPTQPLSLRAATGFRERTRVSTLRFPEGFLDAVDAHIHLMTRPQLPLVEVLTA